MENKTPLEQLIYTLGIDSREFGRLTKISIPTVLGILSGKKEISLNVLNRILRALPHVNENFLMKGEGEMFVNKVIPGDEYFNRRMVDAMETLSIAVLNNSEANKERAGADKKLAEAEIDRAKAELNNSIANMERAKSERGYADGFNRLITQLESVTDVLKEVVKLANSK